MYADYHLTESGFCGRLAAIDSVVQFEQVFPFTYNLMLFICIGIARSHKLLHTFLVDLVQTLS